MKTLNILALAAASIATLACSNDITDEVTNGNDSCNIIVETDLLVEDSAQVRTRANYNAKNELFWQKGDEVALVVMNTDSTLDQTTLKMVSLESQRGIFMGVVKPTQTPLGFVYPAHSYKGATMDSVTFNFPSNYNYTTVGKEFQNSPNSCNMYASCTPKKTINFNPLYFAEVYTAEVKYHSGVLAVKIPCMPAPTGNVTVSSADNMICGNITSTVEDTLVTHPTTDSARREITTTYTGSKYGAPGVFYFPLPTGSYSITVKVEGTNGGQLNSYTSPVQKVDIAAGKILNLTLEDQPEFHWETKAAIPEGYTKQISEGIYQHETDSKLYVVYGEKDNKWHEMVDLGVGATLYAPMNLGAEKPTDYGGYYSFDDAEDAVTYGWGTAFRVPSSGDLSSINNTVRTKCVNGCMEFWKGGSYICMPVAGFRDREGGEIKVKGAGTTGYYWSRDRFPYSKLQAYGYQFDTYETRFPMKQYQYDTDAGMSVRPVVYLNK